MALCCQMIDFIRFCVVNHIAQAASCPHIAVVQKQSRAAIHDVRILVKVIYAFRVKSTRPADDAVDFIALGQKKFCQVRPILPGDAGDDCFSPELPRSNIERLVYRSCD